MLFALIDIDCKSGVLFQSSVGDGVPAVYCNRFRIICGAYLLAIVVGAPQVVGRQPLWKQRCPFFRGDVNVSLVEKAATGLLIADSLAEGQASAKASASESQPQREVDPALHVVPIQAQTDFTVAPLPPEPTFTAHSCAASQLIATPD